MLGQPVYSDAGRRGRPHDGRLSEGSPRPISPFTARRSPGGPGRREFVEFHGEGAASLPLPDRATIANMAPEYGPRGLLSDRPGVGKLPARDRPGPRARRDLPELLPCAGSLRHARGGEIDYSSVLELDLGSVRPSVSGPNAPGPDRSARPEEPLSGAARTPGADGGYGKSNGNLAKRFLRRSVFMARFRKTLSGGGEQDRKRRFPPRPPRRTPIPGPRRRWSTTGRLRPGEEVPRTSSPRLRSTWATGTADRAITSCTNTSNPSVMLGAGLLARKAVERGLSVSPRVKASLAPGRAS